jgi:magnesium transporter
VQKIKYKQGRKVSPWNFEYSGNHKDIATNMQLFVYDNDNLTECSDHSCKQLFSDIDLTKTNWLNVHGLNEIEKIKEIGNFFKIDNFVLSDILNTSKRTKVEEYNDVLFFNIKSILPTDNSELIHVEQLSFLLKENILISFQEKSSDFFVHLRERIRTHSGIVRTKKADYLLYLLLDAIIENFYITIEKEENVVETLIDETKNNSHPKLLLQIEKHRDNYNFLKKAILPLRDSLYSIKSTKEDNVFNSIEKENYSFFERLHQKTLELLEQIEYDLTTLESASNFYFSTQNTKMNEVMKALTAVSVFFMPLTFIVGVYGMNFDNMPELHWKYGYFIVLVSMFLLLVGMVIYFKKKKWY